MDRRIQVGELPLVGRDLPVRVLELLEQQQPELILREHRVDQRKGTHWNARSQAANHGYSHLSGIDITRIEFRWRQWLLRIVRRAGGG